MWPDELIPPELLEKVIGERVRMGDSRFRLRYGLRPAKTLAEQAVLAFWYGQISKIESDSRVTAEQQRPLDMSDLEIADGDVNDAVLRYVQFQRDLSDLVRYSPGVSDNAPQYRHLRYQIRELRHLSTLDRTRRMMLTRRLEEIRVSRGMGQAELRFFRSASALQLVRDTVGKLRFLWEDVHSERRIDEQLHELDLTPAERFHRRYATFFPLAADLITLWQTEFAAARLEFPARPPVDPTTDAVVAAVSAPRSESTTFIASDYASWALGLRDDSRWVLFRKVSGNWHWDRLVEIPKGNQSLLLEVLLEKRGSVHRRDFVERLRTQASYKGEDVEKLSRVITDALSKIKNAIRKTIGDSLKLAGPVPGNPIPNDGTGWMSLMPLGIVEFEQDGRERVKIETYNTA
jgi:hypothetical protein